jgi:transcriptional accessory protein Tex/SPT6
MFVNSCDAFIKELLLSTKVVKKAKRRKAQKFHQYFDWSEPLSKAPSHRLLAMLRAVNEGFVKKVRLMLMPLRYNRCVDFKKSK